MAKIRSIRLWGVVEKIFSEEGVAWQTKPSRFFWMKKEIFRRRNSSKKRAMSKARAFSLLPARISRRFGPRPPRSSNGSSPGRRFWNGSLLGQVVYRWEAERLLQLPGSACQNAEGLDRFSMFYDVYVTRPGGKK